MKDAKKNNPYFDVFFVFNIRHIFMMMTGIQKLDFVLFGEDLMVLFK